MGSHPLFNALLDILPSLKREPTGRGQVCDEVRQGSPQVPPWPSPVPPSPCFGGAKIICLMFRANALR